MIPYDFHPGAIQRMNNKISTIALTLLMTGAIDSIRNLPASAMFGSSLIFFFVLAAVIFLIPTALVSAHLAANVDKGGVYDWVRLAFGEQYAFIAIWLQWINSVIWFPTIFSFMVGTAAYLINPELAQNKVVLTAIILVSFWLLTLINLKGVQVSAKFTSFCTLIGLIIPIVFIIALLLVWLFLGKPLQIQFNSASILPDWRHTDHWLALTAIISSFVGLELSTVHIHAVKNPQKSFPRALAYSTVIILVTMILGSLAIAVVLPNSQINLVNGTIQTYTYYLTAYHLSWLTPLLIILIVIGSLGGIISWIISPIIGLAQAAENGFLPKMFSKKNKNDVPQNLLIAQAILVSTICLVFLLFPSVNASYWLLTALSTQLYVIMYVLMFLAALRLYVDQQSNKDAFSVPGKKIGLGVVCWIGLIGCIISLIVGFIPPSNLDIGSGMYYETVFCGGLFAMIVPVIFFIMYQKQADSSNQKRRPSKKLKRLKIETAAALD